MEEDNIHTACWVDHIPAEGHGTFPYDYCKTALAGDCYYYHPPDAENVEREEEHSPRELCDRKTPPTEEEEECDLL